MAAYQFVNSKGVTYYLHKKDVVLRGDLSKLAVRVVRRLH